MKLTRSKSIFPWNQPQLFVYEFGSFLNSFGRCVYLLSPFEAWSLENVLSPSRSALLSCCWREKLQFPVSAPKQRRNSCSAAPIRTEGVGSTREGDAAQYRETLVQQHYWLSPDRIGWYCCGAELHSTQHPILPKCSRIHKSRPSSSPAGSRPLYQVFITG